MKKHRFLAVLTGIFLIIGFVCMAQAILDQMQLQTGTEEQP